MNDVINQTTTSQPKASLPGFTNLFSSAFSFYKQHLLLIVGISSIPFVLGLIQILADKSFSPYVLMPILALLTAIFSILSYLALLSAVTEENQTVGGAYRKSLKLIIPFLWVSFLAGFATLGGFFLLFIPGIILSIQLSFSMYVLFVENKRGTSALVASYRYVKGYWGAVFVSLFLFGLVFLVINFVIIFATGGFSTFTTMASGVGLRPELPILTQILNLILSSFLTIPLSMIYTYSIYKSLKEIKASAPSDFDEKKVKRNMIIFMVIGIVGVVAMIVFLGFFLFKLLPQLGNIPGSSMASSPILNFLSFGN